MMNRRERERNFKREKRREKRIMNCHFCCLGETSSLHRLSSFSLITFLYLFKLHSLFILLIFLSSLYSLSVNSQAYHNERESLGSRKLPKKSFFHHSLFRFYLKILSFHCLFIISLPLFLFLSCWDYLSWGNLSAAPLWRICLL